MVMKALKIIRNILAVIGAIWLCTLLYTQVRLMMPPTFPWVWKEKMRIPAPSGAYDFVVNEGNRGAMSSFRYECFLTHHGEAINLNTYGPYDPILSCSRIPPEGRWENNSQLIISTEGGTILHLRPYQQEFEVAVDIQAGPLPSPKH